MSGLTESVCEHDVLIGISSKFTLWRACMSNCEWRVWLHALVVCRVLAWALMRWVRADASDHADARRALARAEYTDRTGVQVSCCVLGSVTACIRVFVLFLISEV